eukprot:NODE_13_length_42895_cov_0.518413.p24 type:complete len:115 gc:universal NODE_13_length_42895_cov_0.518413:10001-10345(+)
MQTICTSTQSACHVDLINSSFTTPSAGGTVKSLLNTPSSSCARIFIYSLNVDALNTDSNCLLNILIVVCMDPTQVALCLINDCRQSDSNILNLHMESEAEASTAVSVVPVSLFK